MMRNGATSCFGYFGSLTMLYYCEMLANFSPTYCFCLVLVYLKMKLQPCKHFPSSSIKETLTRSHLLHVGSSSQFCALHNLVLVQVSNGITFMMIGIVNYD